MSATTTACIQYECDGCGEGWAEADVIPHFDVATAEADLTRDYEWTVVDGEHYCRSCSTERYCAANGHDWGEWVESFNYADPEWRDKPAPAEQRFCDRYNCHARESRLPGDDGPRYSPERK